MTVWLCLLGLCVAACLGDNSDQSYVDTVIDLRTKYRQFLPDILTDIPDPPDEESKELNLTETYDKIKKAGYNVDNWSKQDSLDDPAISESKRQWMRRMNPKVKNEYSCEDSSAYRKFAKSLERRVWKEGNTTDVFEDDISDLWDLYMANKTLPPDFPLGYSPPFMFQKYREYSLSYYNITVPTTQHWLLGPLTGDDGVQYDIAMEQYKKYNISKNDPEKVAAADRWLENDLKGKKLNRSKDIARYFIDLRRRLGVTLNWTKPTISISRELKTVDMPDTEEILKQMHKDQTLSEEMSPPDIETNLMNSKCKEIPHYSGSVEISEKTTVTERTTKIIENEIKETTTEEVTLPPSTLFVYHFNPIYREKENITLSSKEKHDIGSTTSTSSTKAPEIRETLSSSITPEEMKTIKSEPSTTDKPVQPEEAKRRSKHLSPTPTCKKSTNSKFSTPMEFEAKYKNHTAVRFLHKHKNKFLLGGMACLIAAKVFSG